MNEIFNLVNEMSPYLLLGFLLAGIMHAFVPNTMYKKFLGGKSWRTVFNAILLGIPLPLCSCGTIPTAMSLRKEGASKGATVSFLISTPQTGVDSIIATYSLIGLPFALMRPIAALFTALFGGLMVNKFDDSTSINPNPSTIDSQPLSTNHPHLSFWQKIKNALHYAFVEMMQDIGKWLMLGLLIAGAITVFVPESFFAMFSDNSILSMLVVLLFSLPMYICATGSIPIAVALMMKGLSPGTALVLLMAGPAVNAASMIVINKVMGKKTLIVYLASIIGGAMAFGLLTDYLLPREWFTDSIAQIKECHDHHSMVFNQLCTIFIIVLLANAFIQRNRKGCCCSHDSGNDCCDDSACTCHHHTDNLVVYVEGMMCNHCKSNAEKAIMSVEGVESVEIDLGSGQAKIKGTAKIDDIRKAVEQLGFGIKG